MKTTIVTFIVSFALYTGLKGQWQIVNEGYGPYSIDFVNKDIGWMCTDDEILRTMDGGETWISFPWNLNLGELSGRFHFINDSVGWVSKFLINIEGWAWYGLFKTVDGGQNWGKILDTIDLGLLWASEDIVIAEASGDIRLKSINGGTTWVDITPASAPGYPRSISFINSDTGIFAGVIYNSPDGGFLQRTFDGGVTWDERIISDFGEISEIGFIDNSTGYFLTTLNKYIVPKEDFRYLICKSNNSFTTWTVISENKYPIHTCHFINEDVCVAIMEDSSSCNIMKSLDGGQTWNKTKSISLPFRSYWILDGLYAWDYNIKFISDKVGYIICYNWDRNPQTLLLKTIDQGDSWSVMDFSSGNTDVCFINPNTGFVVGGIGKFGFIIGTTDGGISWNFIQNNYPFITDCDFVNDSIGYVRYVSNVYFGNSRVSQTIDGGDYWLIYPHDFGQETTIKFLDEQVGFAGNESGIFMTNDGGESWNVLLDSDVISSISPDNFFDYFHFINSIVASDEHNYLALGKCSKNFLNVCNYIIKFTDQGVWEKIIPDIDTRVPFTKILFADENTGWIIGGTTYRGTFQKVFLKTENGGKSWFIKDIPYMIKDLYFKDTEHGWAVGMDNSYKGVILETTNGGKDWMIQMDSLSASLNAIHFIDGIGWAVGDKGLVLKTIDPTSISITENQMTDNSNEIFIQNYPNPFSSSTVINYKVTKSVEVELIVYDLMGRKISTMVKEIQKAGKYEVEWNASGIKPGIYLCELKAGQSRKVIKMVLFQ